MELFLESIESKKTDRTQLLQQFWAKLSGRSSRLLMAVTLGISDLMCLIAAFFLAIATRSLMGPGLGLQYYGDLVIFPIACMIIYWWRGLYPDVGVSFAEELQQLSSSSSKVFVLIFTFLALSRTAENYSRTVIVFTWLFALIAVPAGRMLTRFLLIRLGCWGEPVVMIGRSERTRELISFFQKNLQFGIRPILALDESGAIVPSDSSDHVMRVTPESFSSKICELGIQTAIIVTSNISLEFQEGFVKSECFNFRRQILIPDIHWVGSFGVIPHDLDGLIGLDIQRNLFNPAHQFAKRIIDILLVTIGGLIISPFLAFIAVLIKIDSPGEIFYSQLRVGRNGKPFKMWKFRSMIENADSVLESYLKANPKKRLEWDKNQKLKNDPRITRIGKVLRKFSLDEFPQLINVIKGEMSIVGPRPFFVAQSEMYGANYNLYVRVRPGITGMWQVSGRNGTSFMERADWDEHYVRNWSIWLDIYILLRTIGTVLRRENAY